MAAARCPGRSTAPRRRAAAPPRAPWSQRAEGRAAVDASWRASHDAVARESGEGGGEGQRPRLARAVEPATDAEALDSNEARSILHQPEERDDRADVATRTNGDAQWQRTRIDASHRIRARIVHEHGLGLRLSYGETAGRRLRRDIAC